MNWLYSIIPFKDRAKAIGLFDIVTSPNIRKRIIENAGGDIEVKVLEKVDFGPQQENFINARWANFFANTCPACVDDFIKSASNGEDLPLKPDPLP